MAFQNQPVPSPLPSHAQNDKTPSAQISGVIFPSASRTAATYTSDPILNAHARGIRIYTNVTVDGGSGTVTVSVQSKDPVSDLWKTVTGATTAALTNATSGTTPATLTVYPSIAATANVEVNQVLGGTWRLSVVVANTATFSIGAEYLI